MVRRATSPLPDRQGLATSTTHLRRAARATVSAEVCNRVCSSASRNMQRTSSRRTRRGGRAATGSGASGSTSTAMALREVRSSVKRPSLRAATPRRALAISLREGRVNFADNTSRGTRSRVPAHYASPPVQPKPRGRAGSEPRGPLGSVAPSPAPSWSGDIAALGRTRWPAPRRVWLHRGRGRLTPTGGTRPVFKR